MNRFFGLSWVLAAVAFGGEAWAACPTGTYDCDSNPQNACESTVPCATGARCTDGSGCASGVCAGGLCEAIVTWECEYNCWDIDAACRDAASVVLSACIPACNDDLSCIDNCGGYYYAAYAECDVAPPQCSAVCNGSCSDGIQDDGETGVDCGGPCPTPCPCPQGFADCNGNAAMGCATNLGTDPANCGACGNVCAEAADLLNWPDCPPGLSYSFPVGVSAYFVDSSQEGPSEPGACSLDVFSGTIVDPPAGSSGGVAFATPGEVAGETYTIAFDMKFVQGTDPWNFADESGSGDVNGLTFAIPYPGDAN
jgi:hypothetical protein